MSRIRPLVKYHGGKGRLYPWIISYFPEHETYVEPFGGAASVLCNKPRCATEIYNEIEPQMFNLMHVVQNKVASFQQQLAAIAYNEATFLEHKYRDEGDEVSRAVSFYVAKRMSRGGLCERFCWSKRIYSTGPAEAQSWYTSLKNIDLIHKRLQGMKLYNENTLDFIAPYLQNENTLIYFDPPYMLSTRVSKECYKNNMSLEQHQILAEQIILAKSKVILSGYPSPEYEKWFSDWFVAEKDVANHSCQHNRRAKTRKQECLWMNFTSICTKAYL